MATCDVLVIGGGPAGSTAAAAAARRGVAVIQVEKTDGNRYHIGESLIPFCAYPLRRIGVYDAVKVAGFPVKYGVQFVGTSGAASRPFDFFQYLMDGSAVAWQVWRADFDRLLLDHARAQGVEQRRGAAAERFLIDRGRVVGAVVDGQPIHARMTIDCTGRDALALRSFAWRERDPGLDRWAVWTYFTGHRLESGIDAGNTFVCSLPCGGWFWWIPVGRDRVSVGAVAKRESLFPADLDLGEDRLAAAWQRQFAMQPWIRDHLSGAERVEPFRSTNEYAYRARYCGAPGLILAGDAFGFLDPIFSSGVFLALWSGESAGHVAADIVAGGAELSRLDAYGSRLGNAIESIRRLVYAFYEPTFAFSRIMARDSDARADISDLLNGNFARDYQDFFRQVEDFCPLPAPFGHGLVAARAAAAAAGDPQHQPVAQATQHAESSQ
ncbi:hydroxylase [Planctomycetota bacterium]|nr:hydroxylase [Planctomycetota bacterium]